MLDFLTDPVAQRLFVFLGAALAFAVCVLTAQAAGLVATTIAAWRDVRIAEAEASTPKDQP